MRGALRQRLRFFEQLAAVGNPGPVRMTRPGARPWRKPVAATKRNRQKCTMGVWRRLHPGVHYRLRIGARSVFACLRNRWPDPLDRSG